MCITYQVIKSHSLPHSLYKPLPIPTTPQVDVSVDFILGLPKTQRNKDLIFVVVDRFYKMSHFIPCNKTNDPAHISELCFREMAILHGIHRSIIFDQDTNFLSHFYITLWKKLGTKLKYSTTWHPQTDGQTEITNHTLGTFLRALLRICFYPIQCLRTMGLLARLLVSHHSWGSMRLVLLVHSISLDALQIKSQVRIQH